MAKGRDTRLGRVLIVGAGAVGQVYGRHLQRAGVKVDFYVRPARVDEFSEGFWMYPLNDRALGQQGVHMSGFDLFSSPDELVDERFDQVWLCVPSTALEGPWLKEVLQAAAPESLVSVTPGYQDDVILRAAYQGPIARGLIQFMSYQTPLKRPQGWPTNDRLEQEVLRDKPGIAYWLPPATKGTFGGDEGAAHAAVHALKKGGFPAKFDVGTVDQGRLGSAILMPLVAALQLEGWRFNSLRRGPHLALAMNASREILEVMAEDTGFRPPWWRRFLKPWLGKVMMTFAKRMMPFDIEVFLAYHFTKVGDQTVALLTTFSSIAASKKLHTPALMQLTERRIQGTHPHD